MITWFRSSVGFLRQIYDIAWSGAEASYLKWEENTVKWEEHTG